MRGSHFARRRPPWWPENEPFPPAGPPWRTDWGRRRGKFFLRIGLFLAFMYFSVSFGALALFSLAARFLGLGDFWADPRPLALTALVLPFLFLGFLVLVVLAVRRVALPLGDLVQATERVAGGDYSARVDERVPSQLRGLVHSFNTMTERLRHHEEERRTLLAEVSHELRTPLSVLQGNLEGMIDGIYPRDDAHLETVLEETRMMARLIDDLSLLSHAESGAIKLQVEPTDLGALVAEATAAFRGQADQAGVVLTYECEPGLPALPLDPTRIREVLVNLLANALRYTPRGGTVAVRVWREPGPGPRVAVAVRDSGAGISPEVLPHIFDRFVKSHDSRGVGLGLAIARSLVVAHGGEITAASEPGKGTEIRFTLPQRS